MIGSHQGGFELKSILSICSAALACAASVAGDCPDCAPKGFFARRAERKAARCAPVETVKKVEEKPAVIKTETIYRKVGEKVVIVPVESGKKSK